MKILHGIVLFVALTICCAAQAETPQQAYGVTIVGNLPCSGTSGPGLRCSNLVAHPYILVGGFAAPGDGGGGYFAKGALGCTDNGGTILVDYIGDCFYRMDDRAAVPVKWFGAKCDGSSTVYGGTVAAGSSTFYSTSKQFQTGDVGKVIEFMGASGHPFRTTITAVNTSLDTATLNTPAYNDYPGYPGATKAKFRPVIQGGLDTPGSGYAPGDTLTVSDGTPAPAPATATVQGTGLVNFNISSGGSGYSVGDLITLVALLTPGVFQVRPAQVQVTAVSGTAVTATTPIDYGRFDSTNPTTFSSQSNHGSGFTISLLSSNASFGVSRVKLIAGGGYSALPPIPSTTTSSGLGTGATIDLDFPTPSRIYGSDDTVPFGKIESYLENDYDRGIYNSGELPGDHTCLLETLAINRPVTWRSSGSKQAQLMQIIGNSGSTIDGTHFGFILATASYPSNDTYQDGTNVGQQELQFDNIMIASGTHQNQVDVELTPSQPYTNDGLVFQDPTSDKSTNVTGVLNNLQVVNFPGNGLAAYNFDGEFRAYNLYSGGSGGNCVDIENKGNPYRFYGLVAQGCSSGSGINLVSTGAMEFYGASVFGNNIDVSVTGTTHLPEAYVLFDNMELAHSNSESMYLDQQNEMVVCESHCILRDMNEGDASTGFPDSAVVVGPDATAPNPPPNAPPNVVLRLNQGAITPVQDAIGAANYLDVRFLSNPLNPSCGCTVALGDGMMNFVTGTVTSNQLSQIAGPLLYAGPSVGTQLQLNSSEMGLATSFDTPAAPNKYGLKLRVQCGSNPGTAKLVVLAGMSSSPITLLDNIGTGVNNC